MMIGKSAAAALAPAALLLALLFQPDVARSEDVTIAKNGTVLTLAPTRTAPTEWKVNSGFPLTVMERRGDWMRVTSSRLPDEGGELWVRASQVTGGAGAAGPAGALEKPIGYRVELTGSPGMKFKLECRSLHEGRISFRPHYNKLPQSYEYSSDPLSCVAWKKEHHGELRVTLVEIYPSKERILGVAGTIDDPASIFARSPGPGYPTSLFPSSDTVWNKAAVAVARQDDLVLPPRAQ
jgi:hypothetical protein